VVTGSVRAGRARVAVRGGRWRADKAVVHGTSADGARGYNGGWRMGMRHWGVTWPQQWWAESLAESGEEAAAATCLAGSVTSLP
jgi:hypothetical protein